PAEPPPLIRVRVGTQPTFTRYVFGLPQATAVTTDRTKDRLIVLFDASLRFDLADAQTAPPPGVATIAARPGAGKTAVQFDFTDGPDVRTFREDNNFIVDVLTAEPKDVPADLAARANISRPVSATPGPTSAPPKIAADGAPVPSPAPTPKSAERPIQPAAPPAGAVASKGSEPPAPASALPPASVTPAVSATPPRDPKSPVLVEVVQVGEGLRLTFPFAGATPA